MDIGNIICLNGAFVPAEEAAIPAADGGVLYGVGLFETIRVTGGRPRLLERHLSRLFASAGELGLEIPFGREELAGMASRTAEENKMDKGGLRLTLTAGGTLSRPAVFITARELPYREDQYRTGIRAGFSTIKRNHLSPLVRHKTLNFFENILARREAVAAGWDEAVFLNTAGELAEGSVSNIFLVDRGKVVTPHLQSGLLPGIARRRVLEICASLQVPAEERRVEPAELARAEECFVTNSLMGVMPLASIGDMIIGSGRPGEVTRMIMAGFE